MQITNSAYLAVECMARLTGCTPDRPGKTLWLAQGIKRSVSYTEALMARLRRAGLVKAKKGSGGGYVLSRSPDLITIEEIFNAFDEPRAATAHPPANLSKPANGIGQDAAGTAHLWESLRGTVLRFLSGISLAEVTADGARELWDHKALPRWSQAHDLSERPYS